MIGPVPHAVCMTCDVELETPQRARQHRERTWQAARDAGAEATQARGHSTRTMNPTREQVVSAEIAAVLDEAMYSACEQLDRLIARGEITEEEVTAELSGDFEDAWLQWKDD